MHAIHADETVSVAPDTGLAIREATLADLDAIVALRMALLREHAGDPVYGKLHPDADARAPGLFAQQISSPLEVFLLAERDGEVVGVLRCTESRASPLLLPERYGYLSSAYVVPAARHQGILRWDPLESTCRHASLSIL